MMSLFRQVRGLRTRQSHTAIAILFMLAWLAAMESAARADIGPPRPPVSVRVDFRIYSSDKYSDYLFFVLRTKRDPAKFTLTTDKPTLVGGQKDGDMWLAAVPADTVKALGGEDKLVKALRADKVDGVIYSEKMPCTRLVKYATGAAFVDNYEITEIGEKGIKLGQLTDAEAKKKYGKGAGSGSGSSSGSKGSLLSWFFSSDDADNGPGSWTADELRWALAGLALATAAVLTGVWLARRWFQPLGPAPILEGGGSNA